jgi:hypothetical protein
VKEEVDHQRRAWSSERGLVGCKRYMWPSQPKLGLENTAEAQVSTVDNHKIGLAFQFFFRATTKEPKKRKVLSIF